jgi:hypothetical protein
MSDEMPWSPLTFDANEPLTKCRSWVDPIRADLVWVHLHRQLWQQVVADLDSDPNPDSATWRGHYMRLYVDSQSAAVRRLASGTSKDEISLARLLTTMKESATSFDLDRLSVVGTQSLSPNLVIKRREWLRAHSGDDSNHVGVNIIQADLDRLLRDTAVVRNWTNKAVAHIDQRGAKSPTFGELDAAIDDVTLIFQRYGLLLTGNDYYMEIEMGPMWKAPLKKLFGGLELP